MTILLCLKVILYNGLFKEILLNTITPCKVTESLKLCENKGCSEDGKKFASRNKYWKIQSKPKLQSTDICW